MYCKVTHCSKLGGVSEVTDAAPLEGRSHYCDTVADQRVQFHVLLEANDMLHTFFLALKFKTLAEVVFCEVSPKLN